MKILENVLLSDFVYYRIGGHARYALFVASSQDLTEALTFCKEKQIADIRIIGMGANVVLPDEDFSGAVIVFTGNKQSFELLENGQIKTFAGETMDDMLSFSFDHSLIDLQWAGGLPSSVGGAVRGNAGAFGSEIKDMVVSVEALNRDDQSFTLKTFTHEECHFSYRHSYFKDHPELLIVNVTFQLHQGTEAEVQKAREVYRANIEYRQTHHPMEYPSCGSVFKNIIEPDKVETILSTWPDVRALSEQKWHNKVSMGYIINRLGFSGMRIGGAMVSPKHTNYIVNVEHAKASDVIALITKIQHSFSETFGFKPEPEVMLLTT